MASRALRTAAVGERDDLGRRQAEAGVGGHLWCEAERDRHVAPGALGHIGEQRQLILVVDHHRRAGGHAQLQERERLDGGRDDDIFGRHVASEHLGELALAGDVDAEAAARRLVDQGQCLVGLAGEEDPQLDV
jgi:hypothetical protein